MISEFRQVYLVGKNYIWAAVVALVIVVACLLGSGNDLWLRVYFGAAVIFILAEVRETNFIARGNVNISNLDFWTYAFYLGYTIALILMLIVWDNGFEFVDLVINCGVIGLILGAAFAFVNRAEVSDFLIEKYDLNQSALDKKYGYYLFYFNPIISIGLIAIALYILWEKITFEKSFFFILMLLTIGNSASRYEKKRVSYFRISERVVGFVILMFWMIFLR